MIKVALALWLIAAPAMAEPVLRLKAGSDRLDFDTLDIASAEAPNDAGPVLQVWLTDTAKAELAAFTAAHIGEEIIVSACAEIIVRPRIVEPIRAGALAISMPSPRDAWRTAALLTGEIDCAEHASKRG